jgi:hypothetical protein
VETPVIWHAGHVLVSVHCPKCGARYETTLPATGVRRVRRCAFCNRTGLEIESEFESESGSRERAEPATDGPRDAA